MSLVFSCPVTTAKENSRSSKKGRSEGTHILEEWKFGFYTSKKDFWLADVLTEVMWRVWLVAQWQRICLPMQETRVWSLVREDLSCNGATKPVCHNYWTCALESGNYNYWACTKITWKNKERRLTPEFLSFYVRWSNGCEHCYSAFQDNASSSLM